jgi:ubiquinone/menaquinone biosynthesis C-methylase UbiE
VLSGPDRLHGTPGTFEVVVCGSCGAGWTLPPASPEELGSYYPDAYSAYVPLESGLLRSVQGIGHRAVMRRAFARPPLATLASVPAGDVLDVGCGRGDQAVELRRHGWRVVGIDPSEQACAEARARGVEAIVATLESAPFEPESFDAVVMNHSLEHVTDPRGDLARVSRLLRPGGLLLVSVPNFASWQRERFGSSWYALDLPRHRTHFTRSSFGQALMAEGFEIVSIRAAGDAWVLLSSLQYLVLGRQVFTRPPLAWAGYGLSALLSPVGWVLDRVLGEGPSLAAVARRHV